MKAEVNPQNRYVSDIKLAARYSVTRPTIWRWTRLGQFPKPIKLSTGCTRWRSADVEAFEAAAAKVG